MVAVPPQLRLLRKLLHHGALAQASHLLSRVHPADVADAIESLSADERRRLTAGLVGDARGFLVVRQLSAQVLDDMLASVPDGALADACAHQSADGVCFVLGRLAEVRRPRIIAALPPRLARDVSRLLQYRPGTAGAVMSTEVFCLPGRARSGDAFTKLRQRDDALASVFYVYVVDDEGCLVGVVALRQLIQAPDHALLEQIMTTPPIRVRARDSQETVAELVCKYDFLGLPVVDDDEHLLGVVTVDDVIDVVEAQATKQFYQVAGLDQTERPFSPIAKAARKRLGWTLVNLATALAASAVVGAFRGSIAKMVTLAAYMPIVAGLGGNSGTQSLAVVVRALALRQVEPGRALRVMGRQLAVGLWVGVVAGTVTGAVAFLLEGSAALGLVLLLAMVANMAVGALAGAAVPFVLRLCRQDPALGSGILVTGLTDSFGFLAFLGLATLLWLHGAH